MPGQIVVFGATGYTGELTARALVAQGARPLLVARSEPRVRALADRLGLDYAVADAERRFTLAAVLDRGDVLISTVGPFTRWGVPALEAAIAAGAHYLDSCGEPGFVRRVFEVWGPQARVAGCALLPASGYDYVPGEVAATLALRKAGPAATAVQIGYFFTGGSTSDSTVGSTVGSTGDSTVGSNVGALSGGSRASLVAATLESGPAFRSGRLRSEPAGRRIRSFDVDGRSLAAISVGGSEHLTLPRSHPQLRDVGVYLGWAGSASRLVQLSSVPLGLVLLVPGVRAGADLVGSWLVRGSRGGPDAAARAGTRSLVIAQALDDAGRPLATVRLAGANPYEFTAAFLAWAARQVLGGNLLESGESGESGALGAVEAFGLEQVLDGVALAGLTVVQGSVCGTAGGA